MNMRTTRRKFLAASALAALGTASAASAQTSRPGDTTRRGQRRRSREETPYELFIVLNP